MDQSRHVCHSKGMYSIAYITVPSADVGKTLANKLVQNKLAACVNIIPKMSSISEWEGEIKEYEESLLMAKTRTSRVPDLLQFVHQNHPYEVSTATTVPIEYGNTMYLDWIGDIVPEKN